MIPTDFFGMNFNRSQPSVVSQTFTKSKNSKNENLVPGERSYAQVSQSEAQHADGSDAYQGHSFKFVRNSMDGT